MSRNAYAVLPVCGSGTEVVTKKTEADGNKGERFADVLPCKNRSEIGWGRNS